MIRKITRPVHLKELQNRWILDPIVEKHVRLGSRPVKIHPDKPFELMRWRTGRADTVQTEPIEGELLEKMNTAVKKEYFPDTEDCRESLKARHNLELFLESRGLQLLVFSMGMPVYAGPYHSSVYNSTLDILQALPLHHLSQKYFRKLILGGFSSTSARYSEYRNGTVHMYQSAMMGPRRNYHAILLHEIGHSFERLLSASDMHILEDLFRKAKSRFAIDYLYGEESRKREQYEFGQFVAENYLHYVADSEGFMEFAASQKKQRPLWEQLATVYFRNFCNNVYV
ncbi:hypothetical protein JXA56_01105 [Candidatus Micrarchaeota archaeon]|nr:hypothetical protein [Candidatus Micrarchaeota archaeon]